LLFELIGFTFGYFIVGDTPDTLLFELIRLTLNMPVHVCYIYRYF